MDNITNSEQGGCAASLGGGITMMGIIVILVFLIAFVKYIVPVVVILVLIVSLCAKIFSND